MEVSLLRAFLCFCQVLRDIFRKELQHMLFNRRKAEIEILSSLSAANDDQLERVIRQREGTIDMSKNENNTGSTADMSFSGRAEDVMSLEGNSSRSKGRDINEVLSHEGLGMPNYLLYMQSSSRG